MTSLKEPLSLTSISTTWQEVSFGVYWKKESPDSKVDFCARYRNFRQQNISPSKNVIHPGTIFNIVIYAGKCSCNVSTVTCTEGEKDWWSGETTCRPPYGLGSTPRVSSSIIAAVGAVQYIDGKTCYCQISSLLCYKRRYLTEEMLFHSW